MRYTTGTHPGLNSRMQLNRDMTRKAVWLSIRKKYTYGFTLLEVLIALLVLSIGLLGLAALQTTGLRSNRMANMRTLATHAAYDITDRMRANPRGVAANEYVIGLTDVTDPGATDTALSDLNEWRNNVHGLPGGTSEITQCDTSDGCDGLTHIITVYWDEARTGATGTNCPPLSKDDLRCFRLIYSE
jgi:type IV pilus assembly protein PilV